MLRGLEKKETCGVVAAHGHFPRQCSNDCLRELVCTAAKRREMKGSEVVGKPLMPLQVCSSHRVH